MSSGGELSPAVFHLDTQLHPSIIHRAAITKNDTKNNNNTETFEVFEIEIILLRSIPLPEYQHKIPQQLKRNRALKLHRHTMRPLPILLLLSLHLRTAPALPGIGSVSKDSEGKGAVVSPLTSPQTQTSLFHGFEVMTYLQRDPLTGELLSFEPEPMMAQAVESTGSRIVGRQVGAVTKQVVCQWSPDAPLVVDVKTLADYLANPANVNIVLVQSSPGLKPASVDDCYSLSSKDYYHLFTLAAPATASNPRTPLLSLSLCGKPGNYIPTSTAARHLHDLIRDCTLDDRVAGRVYVRPDEVGGRGEIAVAVWRPVVDGGAVESETGEKEEEDGGGSPMQAQRFAVAGVQRQGSRQDVLVGGVGSGPYTRRL